MNEKAELLAELKTQIEIRKFREKQNFLATQIIYWSAIVVSFITIVVALLDTYTWVKAATAGLSATVILIDKSFPFNARCRWNADYRIKLWHLRHDCSKDSADINEIGERLEKLELEKENTFPYSSLGN